MHEQVDEVRVSAMMNVSLSTDMQYRKNRRTLGKDRLRLVWAGRYRVRSSPFAYLSRVLTQISLKRFFTPV